MSFPTSLDSFTNPLSNQTLNSPSHSGIETAQNTALTALETKVGADSSAVTTSLDYLLKNTSSSNPGHKHTFSSLSDFNVTSAAVGDMLQYDGTKFVNKQASVIPFKFGGTGADGALNISSGTTTLNLGGVLIYIKNYTSISITNTAKLAFSNPHANGTLIILKSQGNVTLSSATSIDASGMGATGSSTAQTAGTNGWCNFPALYATAGGGGTNGSSAAAAQGSAGVKILAINTTGNGFYKVPILAPGAGGGSGSNSVTGNNVIGGGGGGASLINAGTVGSTTSGTGTASGLSPASVGGMGGGALMIECGGTYTNTASIITVAGTAGSTSVTTNISSAGGGGGGSLVVLYNTLGSNTGTYTVSGGAGGTGGTNIAAGGAGGDGYSYVGKNTEFS